MTSSASDLAAIRERHKKCDALRRANGREFCLCGAERPCDTARVLEALEEAQLRGAQIAWDAMLSLMRSGTPFEGLMVIAENNTKHLRAARKATS